MQNTKHGSEIFNFWYKIHLNRSIKYSETKAIYRFHINKKQRCLCVSLMFYVATVWGRKVRTPRMCPEYVVANMVYYTSLSSVLLRYFMDS